MFAKSMLAAALVTFAAIPADAGAKLNGIRANGVGLNGPILQGAKLNGWRLNSPILQGAKLNGVGLNGPVLQGIKVNGDAFGHAVDGAGARVIAIEF
jgi:uncharacterized protein YjbI with pentapeptide repeats